MSDENLGHSKWVCKYFGRKIEQQSIVMDYYYSYNPRHPWYISSRL